MQPKTIRALSIALGILLTLTFLLGWLAQSVLSVGQREGYYLRSFTKYRVWEGSGISEADALRIAEALPRYLDGDLQALSMEIPVWDEVQPAFHEGELSHMWDVYRLFSLAEGLFIGCAMLFVGLFALLLLWRGRLRLRTVWRAALWSLMGIFALAAGLAIWGAADFASLFTAFHRLAFTNDLWLMNPATDLMIRLMPQQMFLDGAVLIALWFLCGMAVFIAGLWALTHLHHKEKPAKEAEA